MKGNGRYPQTKSEGGKSGAPIALHELFDKYEKAREYESAPNNM